MIKIVPWRLAPLGLLALLMCSPAAHAADPPAAADSTPKEIGGASGWTAYSYTDKGGKVCYVVGHPAKSEPQKLTRSPIDLLVTHRPGEKAVNVVQFDVGTPFKEKSTVDLDIGGKKFSLFSNKDAAWAPDAATDKAVTEALSKGKEAVLKGTSAKAAALIDTYTLDGFALALVAIDKACGVKR